MFKLPNWCITKNKPGFYDTESATAIEQTAKLYAAMQEVIEEHNTFIENITKKFEDFKTDTNADGELFRVGIRQEFQDFIDVVELRLKEIKQSIKLTDENVEKMYDQFIKAMNGQIEFFTQYLSELITETREDVKSKVTATIEEMRNDGAFENLYAEDFADHLSDFEKFKLDTYDTDDFTANDRIARYGLDYIGYILTFFGEEISGSPKQSTSKITTENLLDKGYKQIFLDCASNHIKAGFDLSNVRAPYDDESFNDITITFKSNVIAICDSKSAGWLSRLFVMQHPSTGEYWMQCFHINPNYHKEGTSDATQNYGNHWKPLQYRGVYGFNKVVND